MGNITVYGRPSCVQCTNAKAHLDKEGVPYEYVNVDENLPAYKLALAMGTKTLPLLVFEGASARDITYCTGYDATNLAKLLEGRK